MSASQPVSIRLSPRTKKDLDRVAKSQRRSRSFVAEEAIREYLSVNDWQVSRIKEAIESADRGEFATDDEVKATFRRLKQRAR